MIYRLKTLKLASLFILETLKESQTEGRRRASIDRETSSSFKVYHHNSEEEILRDIKFDKVDSEIEQKFDLVFYEEGSYSLRIKALYTVESELGYNYDSEETVVTEVTVIPPFRTSSKWNLTELIIDTPSRLSVNIWLQKIISEEIKIHKLSLSTKDGWKLITQEDTPAHSGSLRQFEHFSGCFELMCSKAGKSLDPGDLLIAWSRKGDTMSVCRVPLASVQVKEVPIAYTVYYESEVFVNQTFQPKLKMKNMTDSKLVVRIKVLENSVFLLGGFEQVSMELDPNGSLEVNYAMYPIMTGQHQTPVIQLNTEDWESSYSQSILVIP